MLRRYPLVMPTDRIPAIPKAILCDMDGVLRHWESARPLEDEFGLPAGSIRACAFADDLVMPAITGACTDEEWRGDIVKRLAANVSRDVAEMVVGRWSEPSGWIDPEMLNLLGSLRERGHTVILVTNATTRLMNDLTKLAIHDRFDGIVNSAVVGVAKPDAAIYHHAVELAGVAPPDCLFIDDLPANVAAASQLGMIGLHFTGMNSVRAILR